VSLKNYTKRRLSADPSLSAANKTDSRMKDAMTLLLSLKQSHTHAQAIHKHERIMNAIGGNDNGANDHDNNGHGGHQGEAGYEWMEAELEKKIKEHEVLKRRLAKINRLKALDQVMKRKRRRHNQPK
jgi:hypothetical protein